MKRFLKNLCFGWAATLVAATSFAEVRDVTAEYLRNADMEQGIKYWALDGSRVMGKNTKNVTTQVGFHGMNQGVLEIWNADYSNPLTDNITMQKKQNLPNGTYVFGAYVGATRQGARVRIEDQSYRYGYRYEYWSNRDSIVGVSLFANEDEVAVATDNPDFAQLGIKWAHSSKFNVATTVTDGTLHFGLKVENTNANYVVWDNATLYYFGDMSEAEALDVMAEIDMTKAAEIADTLVNVKMNLDTLANLEAAIAKVKNETTTAATLWDDNEDLFYNMGLARRSAADYENLKKHIESAIVVMNGEWSEFGMDVSYNDLVDAVNFAEEAYEEAVMNRAELNELRAYLAEMVGWMRVDSLYTALDALDSFIYTPNAFTGGPGKYSVAQQNQLKELQVEVIDSVSVVEDMYGNNARPQDLYPYIAKIYEAIESVKNNPIPSECTKMPIEFKAETEGDMRGWIEGAEWYSEYDKIMSYTSPLYLFESKVETFRITVNKNKDGAAYFCLSELEFYDANGDKIILTEDNVSTEYDHNTLNPHNPDGGGIAALFDGNHDTYFHSAWQNSPAGEHYLDVTLPNGGYNAFSFRMFSRSNSSGWDQSHTFPGEMIVDTPKPERDALKVRLDEAKALNPYSFPEVGYYVGGEAALEEIAAAIAEAEALIANNAAESEMSAAQDRLRNAIYYFEELLYDNGGYLPINLPEAGKVYRIVSAFPGFYEKQSVEKAMTVNAATNTLWWENVCADSLQQEFIFEPVLQDGEHYIEIESLENYDGSTTEEIYYCYYLKNVQSDCYVNVDNEEYPISFQLEEEPTDTVRLKWLGRGQWNLIINDYDELASDQYCMHAGDHNSGNPSTSIGAYGGTAGIGSAIISWPGNLDTSSAWFIREMPELPLAVQVENGEFKSECIHFEAAEIITLTADKACAFDGLALYDLYGNEIAIDELVVSSNTATITQTKKLVECAFVFTNHEGVSAVSFDTDVIYSEPISEAMTSLEEAYAAASAFAPVQGTGVGQYTDITGYTVAMARAEAMIETGATDEEIYTMIAELEAAVAGLTPNMPVPGRMYYIVSAMDAFVNYHGVSMMIYDNEMGAPRWTYENLYEINRCWEFEPAENEEGYYIKNVATGMYMGYAEYSTAYDVLMVNSKEETVPYVISSLQGDAVAIATSIDSNSRLHTRNHSSGRGQSGNICYWGSGAGTGSAWRICDAEAYGLEYFAFYAMEALYVEAEASSTVNIPIRLQNTTAVTAFQFDLYLPDGVSPLYTMEDGDIIYNITFNGERAKDSHVLAASMQADGALRVVAYSTMDEAFVGNDGVLLNVAVAVDDIVEGNYPITLRNVRMVKNGATEVLGDDYTAYLTVTQNTLMGDVNSDGTYTMIDVVMMVNAVLEKTQENFNANAADMNGDGDITMVDVVNVLHMVLTDGEAMVASARSISRGVAVSPELGAGEFAVVGDGRVVLPVALNNSEAYSAFQLDVVLPAGVELAEATLTGRAKASHAVAWNTLQDGTTRVVAYAVDNAAFRDNEGALLNLVLETSDEVSADAVLTIEDGLFATAGGAEHRAADINVMMRAGTTGIDETCTASFRVYGVEGAVEVVCGADTVVSVYAATGQLVNQTAVKAGKTGIALPAGVYMVNGNKVIVK